MLLTSRPPRTPTRTSSTALNAPTTTTLRTSSPPSAPSSSPASTSPLPLPPSAPAGPLAAWFTCTATPAMLAPRAEHSVPISLALRILLSNSWLPIPPTWLLQATKFSLSLSLSFLYMLVLSFHLSFLFCEIDQSYLRGNKIKFRLIQIYSLLEIDALTGKRVLVFALSL